MMIIVFTATSALCLLKHYHHYAHEIAFAEGEKSTKLDKIYIKIVFLVPEIQIGIHDTYLDRELKPTIWHG